MIPQPTDQVPLFQELAVEERQIVISRMRRRNVAAGEMVYSENHPSDAMYVVHSGMVKLTSGYNKIPIATLGTASLLGEVDCLLSRPYSASAQAATETHLLVLSRSDLEEIMNEHPGIGLKFGSVLGIHIPYLEDYLVQNRLREIELLTALSEEDLLLIAQSLGFSTVERGDLIFEAGDAGNAAYFIEQGSVRIITDSADGTSFDDLNEGDLFGHTSLITGKPYGSTARAISAVGLWVLARENYQYLIEERPAIKLAFSRALAETLSATDQAEAVERMRALDLFTDVPNEALTALAARLVLRHFPAEEAIYTEGTPGDAMYIVEAGEIKLMDNAFSDAQMLERIRPGTSFGEMALLTGRTRAECARAAVDTTVWVLYKNDFDEVMVRYPEISVSLSRAITERLSARENDFVIRHLRRIALFANLTNAELNGIAKKVRGLRFRPGEIICFGGQPAHTLYMIERGEVKRIGVGPNGEPVTIDLLDTGDSFGEQAIVQNTGYEYTAQALEDVEVWTISKADFVGLMEQFPSLSMMVTRLIAGRLSQAQTGAMRPTNIHTPSSRPPSGFTPPPRPPAPPSGRIQRPPSGARPISKAEIAPTPGISDVLHHTEVPNRAPRPPLPDLFHWRQRATAPKTYERPAHHSGRGFFAEAGDWVAGLSFGAKLRALTVGSLALWLLLIALPFTTISAVSSTVGGLQVSNNASDDLPINTSRSTNNDPFNGLKVAFAIPTETPQPTATPRPTSTPRPTPTRVLATRVPPPPPPPAAVAAPVAAIPALPPIEWDPRLGNGPQVLPLMDAVKLIPANVGHGQKFWRAIKVKFEDITESGNDHTIYVKVIDENGKRVDGKKAHLTSVGGLSEYPDEKPAADMCDCNYNYPMYGDGYGFNIEDQYPSDKVVGMIMPMHRHVNFKLVFQLTTNP